MRNRAWDRIYSFHLCHRCSNCSYLRFEQICQYLARYPRGWLNYWNRRADRSSRDPARSRHRSPPRQCRGKACLFRAQLQRVSWQGLYFHDPCFQIMYCSLGSFEFACTRGASSNCFHLSKRLSLLQSRRALWDLRVPTCTFGWPWRGCWFASVESLLLSPCQLFRRLHDVQRQCWELQCRSNDRRPPLKYVLSSTDFVFP